MPPLYVVEAQSSGGCLRRAIPKAEIIVWGDALYDGPVPGGLSLRDLSRVRSRYCNAGSSFSKRDHALAQFHKFDEVVLWFGPTVVSQLSLIQVLDWFSAQRVSKLTLLDQQYVGWLAPEQVAAQLRSRRPVTAAMLRVGRRAWKAFTAPDPRRLTAFLNSDSLALPELRPMLTRIAEEYPDAAGLSRIERKLLAQFKHSQKGAYAVAQVMRDETFGDLYYFEFLDRFISATNQLLCFAQPPADNLRVSVLVATEFGRRVLAGKADAIVFNGIDRWIGGVHLEGYDPPRRF